MNRQYWPRRLSEIGVERNSSITRFVVLGVIDIVSILVVWTMIVQWTAEVRNTTGLAVLGSIILCQIIIGSALSLYRNRFAIGSALELRRQGIGALIVSGLGLGIAATSGLVIGLPWFLLAMLSAQMLMIAGRQALRMWLDSQFRPQVGQRVVIVGAGEAGSALVSQMLGNPESEYIPVAMIDDDRAKTKSIVHGVKVAGRIDNVQTVVDDYGADGVIVAIAEAPATVFATIVSQIDLKRVWVRTIPPLSDLLSGDIDLAAVRDLDVADLIGRQPMDIDPKQIESIVKGKTVLVTGAGGSIGSELVRLIALHSPQRLIMLDRDESALHALCLSMDGRALMESEDLVLADIRDFDALESVFAETKPQIVFHAAALKHLPMLERFPGEGWKTNVHGSLNVLRAAADHDVERFVNISTDKAASPTSELGRSKFVAERLTSHFAEVTGRPYVSVRFGNVLGSRGSVLISFADQIRRGAAVTITHPEVTRFFMTIPEACLLVLSAASEGRSGETLVLDMGTPVRIVDIAQRMMSIAGRSCPITYTGLRDGEKLHEDLFTPDEGAKRTASGSAWHVDVAPLEPALLDGPFAPVEGIAESYERYVADVPTAAPVQLSTPVPSTYAVEADKVEFSVREQSAVVALSANAKLDDGSAMAQKSSL
ncbi:FlaA1/EpsC-like NDP-sugar epimerase [Brevibacterium epidermidis]|jgi:FlaA1/EpsC-like NDP-sugar epimerase|uniref:FlaA1/EpsC-like NDP-sugar epimerase n=1 Tax=Brevibacterium epidermidis TaxID=1698 RepID=A0ABV4EGJ8_BREEP